MEFRLTLWIWATSPIHYLFRFGSSFPYKDEQPPSTSFNFWAEQFPMDEIRRKALSCLPKLFGPRLNSVINSVTNLLKFVKSSQKELLGNMPGHMYPYILRDPAYGKHKFIQLPGIRLHYIECGSKNNELLLFVHGFPDFWYTWKNQIKEFSKDYWVIAVDMRGYGESEKSKKNSFYKIDLLVNDIKYLVLKLGKKKFTLVAHDWGGVIAHYFIRIHPEMLNKYILLNTVFHPKLSCNIFTKQFFKSWYVLLMQIPYIAEYFFISNDLKKIKILFQDFSTPEELEAYKYTFGSYDSIKGPINYYRANFKNWKKSGIPTADKLNERKVPGLYIHGEDDLALTLNTAFKKSFEDVKNIQCISVPNAGHFVHIHSSDVVNKIIREFLKINNKQPLLL